MKMETAIGFRVHSGWAAMVVVTGSPESPKILERARIELIDGSIPGSKQPFHRAAALELDEARTYLDRCAAQSRKLARAAIEMTIRKHKPAACGLGISSARPMGTLEATLASHAAIHSAEGEFFRDAIAHAAEGCGLRCTRVREKELANIAKANARLAALRKILGPPWTQDEKFAALAAWIALKS